MRIGLIALTTMLAGCASNNVAELAARVRIVDDPAQVAGCRPLGRVVGDGNIGLTARRQAQRRTLYLGGDVLMFEKRSETSANAHFYANGTASVDPSQHHAMYTGYAFACAPDGPLSRSLVGATRVPANQITVASAAPSGCDEIGAPVEAFADGQPGSAEDGLRRMAALAYANYVQLLKQVEYDGRPALRGQPYACAVAP